MALFQMHPFVQHFNAIMRNQKLFYTFEDCAAALRSVNETLRVGVLSSVPVQLIAQEFPGMQKISHSELSVVWQQFSSTPIDKRASRSDLLLKANHLLSYLVAVRRALSLGEESLIGGAQRFVFAEEYASLSGTGELMPHLYHLNALLYGTQQQMQPTVEQFTQELDADLATIELAFEVVCARKVVSSNGSATVNNLFECMNVVFRRFNKPSLRFPDVAPFGCETQMRQEELCDLMNLVQKYLSPANRRVGCNALVVLINIMQEISDALQGAAITEMLVLIAKAAEVDIFSIQEVDKQQFFAYYFYMIVGELKVFTEDEFYVQALSACNCLVNIINFIFPGSRSIKSFDGLLAWLYKYLKPHSYDRINPDFRLTKDFEVFDKDLAKFIKDVGGARNGFKAMLQLWLLGKSIFENARSIFDLLAIFVYETIRTNGAFQERIGTISEEARQLQLLGDEYDVQVLLSQVKCMIAE